MLYHDLMNLGLSEKEAKIYLAALELGASPVQQISRKANVNRATTYANIESLMKINLMSSYKQGKKQFFYSEQPEKIVFILIKKQQDELAHKEKSLNKIVPQLKALQSHSDRMPVVRYFDGKMGVISLIQELMEAKEGSTLREIFPQEQLDNIFDEKDLQKLKELRVQRNIFAKAIFTAIKERHVKKGEYIMLTPKELPISCNIAFYGGSISIISLKEPLAGVIIKDKNIAETFNVMFDILYDLLKEKYKK